MLDWGYDVSMFCSKKKKNLLRLRPPADILFAVIGGQCPNDDVTRFAFSFALKVENLSSLIENYLEKLQLNCMSPLSA